MDHNVGANVIGILAFTEVRNTTTAFGSSRHSHRHLHLHLHHARAGRCPENLSRRRRADRPLRSKHFDDRTCSEARRKADMVKFRIGRSADSRLTSRIGIVGPPAFMAWGYGSLSSSTLFQNKIWPCLPPLHWHWTSDRLVYLCMAPLLWSTEIFAQRVRCQMGTTLGAIVVLSNEVEHALGIAGLSSPRQSFCQVSLRMGSSRDARPLDRQFVKILHHSGSPRAGRTR